jgi:hypothetical protein
MPIEICPQHALSVAVLPFLMARNCHRYIISTVHELSRLAVVTGRGFCARVAPSRSRERCLLGGLGSVVPLQAREPMRLARRGRKEPPAVRVRDNSQNLRAEGSCPKIVHYDFRRSRLIFRSNALEPGLRLKQAQRSCRADARGRLLPLPSLARGLRMFRLPKSRWLGVDSSRSEIGVFQLDNVKNEHGRKAAKSPCRHRSRQQCG